MDVVRLSAPSGGLGGRRPSNSSWALCNMEGKHMGLDKLKKKDLIKAAQQYAKAMMQDDLHVYFFPEEKTRYRKLLSLYTYKIKNQIADCYITSENLEGLAIWEKPYEHHNNLSAREVLSGTRLIFECGISSLFRMLKYQIWSTRVRNRLIEEPYWYLDVVIVSPEFQGKGFASKLIKPFLEEASSNGSKVYLETQNKNNVPIYEKYGFRLIKVLSMNSISQYCMIK
jgi:hypothetical protein